MFNKNECISRTNHPLLYDYFICLGYVQNDHVIELPLAVELQSKGRFTDIAREAK